MIFESGHRGQAGFRRQAGLLTALYLERLGFYKSLKQIVQSISLEHILKYFLRPTQKNDTSYPPKTGIVQCDL